ncbi:MAG: MOSC domain-containing protein [Armatimonadetes bacterium]|nr:MOSC domain-containing protein [Anaerolineae bacterium]
MHDSALLSIQVGMPGVHDANAKPWESGIFKHPVSGRVWLDTLNLAGDAQQDLKVHGGPFRAVLLYSASHYPVWRAELDLPDFPYGAFGENLTISYWTETTAALGDIYELGEARIQVTQPRQPCWKLARRWGLKDLTARVAATGWGGWYARVLQPGYIEAGDALKLTERLYPEMTIARLNALINQDIDDPEALALLADAEPLTPGWRQHFAKLAG